MRVKCCGVYCKTAFCPHCGKAIKDKDPLLSLLEHIELNVQAMKKRSERHPREIRPQTLEMWTRWEDALRKLLNERDSEK